MATRETYTVSRLNQEARTLLEGQFASLWVEGEVSNLTRPSSGHLYFSLKDARAQIRCALFQNRAFLFRDCPHNGQQVLVRGRVSLYEPRGDYQIIVDYVEEAGAGALQRAYDTLRLKLEREGLFALERKRPLPAFPRQIGVITSPTGAAIRDVLATLRRRCPSLPVLVYPVPVQGEGATAHIARTLHLAAQRQDCDVLLLVRGGGSLEDLATFNDETVVRAICQCSIPVVAGIGHETDVTIADFAADARAATPTAAAALAGPDMLAWLVKIGSLDERLQRAIQQALHRQRRHLHGLQQRLVRQEPRRRLLSHTQRVDELDQRLRQALYQQMNRERIALNGLAGRLGARALADRVRTQRRQWEQLAGRLGHAMHQRVRVAAQRNQTLSGQLHVLSPLATLERGYAILRRPTDRAILRRASQTAVGETLEVLLSKGRLHCEITALSGVDFPNTPPTYRQPT